MEKNKNKALKQEFPVISLVAIFFMTLFALLGGSKLLGNEFGVVMRWWFAIFAAGLAFLPLSFAVFGRFSDGGYVVAKALGVVASSWVVWLLSSVKILKFTETNSWIGLGICAVLNYGIYAFFSIKKHKNPVKEAEADKVSRMMYHEVLFLIAFLFFCYMRSFRPEIDNQTEKYMDFGFLASIMNSEYMPPRDIFFSGKPINYYYYGIYIGGYLGKLANTTAGFAYNLDLMTICSLGFVQVYALVAEVLKWAFASHDKKAKAADPKAEETKRMTVDFWSHMGGMLAGFAAFIAGNMHYVLYGVVYPFFDSLRGVTAETSYYFPSSTRFISDGEGNLIHEFPCYSFVLGDLHAHVTDITNVLLIMTVLFGFLLNRSERMKKAREEESFEKVTKKSLIREFFDPAVLIASFLIGIIRMSNSWDFPIYFVISGAVLLFSNAIIMGFKKDTLILTAMQAVECVLISSIVSLPFTLPFESMTAGIGFATHRSNPYELAVLWALPISACGVLYSVHIKKYKEYLGVKEDSKAKKGKIKKETEQKGFIYSIEKGKEKDSFGVAVVKEKKINHLYSFIFKQEFQDLFMLTLAICAVGLVLMCEIVFVRDIYGDSYSRSNTMFKLTYQAYMIFAMIMSFTFIKLIAMRESKGLFRYALVATGLLVWTFFYFGNATNAYVGDLLKPDSKVRTLDSYNKIEEAEISHAFLGYADAAKTVGIFAMETQDRTKVLKDMIMWVNENTEPDAVFASMPATAYQAFATISAYTGRPAVLGWHNHEWLWRNGGELVLPASVLTRKLAMQDLYSTSDPELARQIIETYDIDYIYVNYTETLRDPDFWDSEDPADRYYRGRNYRPIKVNHEVLKSLGEVVFDAGTQHYTAYRTDNHEKYYDYEYQAYIVKVNK